MFSCCRSSFQRDSDRENIVSEVKATCSEFWQDVKMFFSNLCNNNNDHSGVIQSVVPIETPVPEGFEGKCYHLITLEDQTKYRLIFSTKDFTDLESKLVPGKMIKILYHQPDNTVVNIWPIELQKVSVREAPLQDILEDLEDDDINIREVVVKAHYLNDKLRHIEVVDVLQGHQ